MRYYLLLLNLLLLVPAAAHGSDALSLTKREPLYMFVQNLYQKWGLDRSVNIEFSIKFTKDTLVAHRSVVQIPAHIVPKDAYDDLLALVPQPELKEKFKSYLRQSDGALMYGFEENNGHKRYKVYFDFLKTSDKGIDSYEWEAGMPQRWQQRQYARQYFAGDLKEYKYLNHESYDLLKEQLDFAAVLEKQAADNNSLCIRFKPDVLMQELNSLFYGLADYFAIKRSDVVGILHQIAHGHLVWVNLGKQEAAFYYRFNPWVWA